MWGVGIDSVYARWRGSAGSRFVYTGPILRMAWLRALNDLSQGLGFRLYVPRTPKVCKIIALMADLMSLGLVFYMFWGF